VQTILLSSEEVAQHAMKLYEAGIRETVEIEGNIGKMVIIDIETGAYSVDLNGIESAQNLRQQNPTACPNSLWLLLESQNNIIALMRINYF
jgi:hypothetical protein